MVLLAEAQAIKTKTISCLDIIYSNGTFSITQNDHEKYKIMFHNSAIARTYS